MNRRSFLRGTGVALLGIASLAFAAPIKQNKPPHVEYVIVNQYEGMWQTKIKMSSREDYIEHWTKTREQGEWIAADTVRMYGWKDGSTNFYYAPTSSVDVV